VEKINIMEGIKLSGMLGSRFDSDARNKRTSDVM
jgi:hypothetical protein